MSDNIQNKDDLIKQSGNSQEDSHLPNSKHSKQNPIYEAVIVKKDEALLKLMKLETLKALNFNFITTNSIINQYLEREYQNNSKNRDEILNQTSAKEITDICFIQYLLNNNKNIFQGDSELSSVFTLEFLTLEEISSPKYSKLTKNNHIDGLLKIPPRKEAERAKINITRNQLIAPFLNAIDVNDKFDTIYTDYEISVMDTIMINPSASQEEITEIIKNTNLGKIFHASNSDIAQMISNSQWRNDPEFHKKQQEVINNLNEIGCFSFSPKIENGDVDISMDEAINFQNNLQKHIIYATEKIGIKPNAFGHYNSLSIAYSKEKNTLGAFQPAHKKLSFKLNSFLNRAKPDIEAGTKTIIHEWLHSLDNLVMYKLATEQEKMGLETPFNSQSDENDNIKSSFATQYFTPNIDLPSHNKALQAYNAMKFISKQMFVGINRDIPIKWEINQFIKKTTDTFIKDILEINKKELTKEQQQLFKTDDFKKIISSLSIANDKNLDEITETLDKLKEHNINIDNNKILAKYKLFRELMLKEKENQKLINKTSFTLSTPIVTGLNIDELNIQHYIKEYPELSPENIQQTFNLFNKCKKTKISNWTEPTNFIKNSILLDRKNNQEPYYQMREELFARYGESNLYLTQYEKYLGLFNRKIKDKELALYAYDDRYTIPTPKEQKQFNIALQHCISNVLGQQALRDDTIVAKNINAYDEMLKDNLNEFKLSVFALKSSLLIKSCATTLLNTTIEANHKISKNLNSVNEKFKNLIDIIINTIKPNNITPDNQNNTTQLTENKLNLSYQNLGNSIVNNIAGISGITNNFKTLNLITTELTSNNQTPLTSQTPNNPILPILPTSPMPYTPNNINNDTINLILNVNRFKENCGDKIPGNNITNDNDDEPYNLKL